MILSVAKSENLSKQFLYEKPSKGLKYLVITFTAHELALYAPPEESYDYVHVCKGTSDRGTLGRSSKSFASYWLFTNPQKSLQKISTISPFTLCFIIEKVYFSEFLMNIHTVHSVEMTEIYSHTFLTKIL